MVGCGALDVVLGHHGQLGRHAVVKVEEDGDDEAGDQGPRYPLALQLPHVLQRQPVAQAGGGRLRDAGGHGSSLCAVGWVAVQAPGQQGAAHLVLGPGAGGEQSEAVGPLPSACCMYCCR